MGLLKKKTEGVAVEVRGLAINYITLYFNELDREILRDLSLKILLIDKGSRRQVFYLVELEKIQLLRYDSMQSSLVIGGADLKGPFIDNPNSIKLSNIDLLKPTFSAHLISNKDIELQAEIEFDLNSMKYAVQCTPIEKRSEDYENII